MKNALLSAADKTGLAEFAQALIELDYRLIASGGTAKAIEGAKLPVTNIETWVGAATGKHAVVTLHGQVHEALQLTTEELEGVRQVETGVPFINLACVIPYNFEEAMKKYGHTRDQLNQYGVDVGGYALIGSAYKGDRILVSSTSQYEKVLRWGRADYKDERQFKDILFGMAFELEVRERFKLLRWLSNNRVTGALETNFRLPDYGERVSG